MVTLHPPVDPLPEWQLPACLLRSALAALLPSEAMKHSNHISICRVLWIGCTRPRILICGSVHAFLAFLKHSTCTSSCFVASFLARSAAVLPCLFCAVGLAFFCSRNCTSSVCPAQSEYYA